MNQAQLTPAISYGPPFDNDASFRSNYSATTAVSTWNVEPQLNYQEKIGAGKLDVLIGSTLQQSSTNSLTIYGTGFASDALINNIQAASTQGFLGATNIQYRYNALYGRIGYNWKEKYLINATVRRDGSSRFGP